MNYSIPIEHLKEMATFAMWVSLLVVPAVAAAKARIPNMKGWVTLLVAVFLAWFIVGGLVYPTTGQAFMDCLLIGFTAAVIAVGGDSYLFRLIGKTKGAPPSLAPTDATPEDRATVPPSFPPEAPTKPDNKP